MINDVGPPYGLWASTRRGTRAADGAPPYPAGRCATQPLVASSELPRPDAPSEDAEPADDLTHRQDAAPERFISLFLENERRIQAFIYCLLPNLADADDVLQDTSLILWQKFSQFQPGTDFLAWACRIAQYRVMKFHERRGRSRLRFDAQTLDGVAAEALEMQPLLDARHQALAQCLESLNARDRDLVQRRYGHDCSPQQVAAQVGRSVDAVYKALSRIHDTLMSCIQHKLARE